MYYSPGRYYNYSILINVQLACVKQNSSVHSEPGSNSSNFININYYLNYTYYII